MNEWKETGVLVMAHKREGEERDWKKKKKVWSDTLELDFIKILNNPMIYVTFIILARQLSVGLAIGR